MNTIIHRGSGIGVLFQNYLLKVPFYSFMFGDQCRHWVYIEADNEAEARAKLQNSYEGGGNYVLPLGHTDDGNPTEYINIPCHPDDVRLVEVWE